MESCNFMCLNLKIDHFFSISQNITPNLNNFLHYTYQIIGDENLAK